MSRVIVIGGTNMDIGAKVKRNPRSGETMPVKSFVFVPGGKGSNQAIAAHRALANTHFVGKVGDDLFARMLKSTYKKEKLSASLSTAKDTPTGAAFIVVDEKGENSIYASNGANSELTSWDLRSLNIRKSDIVSATLETPLETLIHVFYKAKKIGATTVLNAAPIFPGVLQLLKHVDYCVVNETELSSLTGKRVTDKDSALRAMRGLRPRVQNIITTLGKKGIVALIGEKVVEQRPFPAKVIDTTGAGDCFVGTFVTRLKETGSPMEAMRFGCAAAALCVERIGASSSMPKRGEINEMIDKHKNL